MNSRTLLVWLGCAVLLLVLVILTVNHMHVNVR